MRRQNFRRNFNERASVPRSRRWKSIRKFYYQKPASTTSSTTRTRAAVAPGTGDVPHGPAGTVIRWSSIPMRASNRCPARSDLEGRDLAGRRLASTTLPPSIVSVRSAGCRRHHVHQRASSTTARAELDYSGRVEMSSRVSVEPRISINSAEAARGIVCHEVADESCDLHGDAAHVHQRPCSVTRECQRLLDNIRAR